MEPGQLETSCLTIESPVSDGVSEWPVWLVEDEFASLVRGSAAGTVRAALLDPGGVQSEHEGW